MKAYVILKTCERTEFETLLFDADEVIDYLNKNQCSGFTFEVKTFDVPISIPAVPYRDIVCKTWNDCTNPFKDCMYCPLRFSGEGHKDSVIGDTIKVTYTGDTQDSLHQTVTDGCSNFTTKLGSLKDSNLDDLDYIPNKK